MKHIKQDFSLKAWVRTPVVNFGGGGGGGVEAKIKLFQKKLKLTMFATTWWQMFCPQTHP